MDAVQINFLDSDADGIRRIRTANWSGACFIIPRKRVSSSQIPEELLHPGVYVLAGPYEVDGSHQPPRLVSKLYIGQSDSLDERLRQHCKSKEFWSTAFAFLRVQDDLHAGEVAHLEAILIAQAKRAPNRIENVLLPQPSTRPEDAASMETFASHIGSLMKILGHDYFDRQDVLVTSVKPHAKDPSTERQPTADRKFLSLMEYFKQLCLAFPDTEFYSTQTPDWRAKVVHNGHFRVFARVVLQRHGLKVIFPIDSSTLFLADHEDFGPALSDQLSQAHDVAMQKLA